MRCRIWMVFGFSVSQATALFSGEVETAAPQAPARNVIEEFDVERGGDVLLLPVTINGRKGRFAVNTAQTTAFIDTALPAPVAVASDEKSGEQPDAEKERVDSPRILVGNSRLPVTDKVIRQDLFKIRIVWGHDFDGALGMDFFRSHVVHIDFDAGKLVLLKSVPDNRGTEFAIQWNRNSLPTVQVSSLLDDEPIPFIVATGVATDLAGILNKRTFDKLVEAGRLAVRGDSVTTGELNGLSASAVGVIDGLKLGPFQHPRLAFEQSTGNALGLGYLSRFVVTFDFPNNRVYLKEGKRFAKDPVPINRAGLVLVRREGDTRLHIVDENSAAYRSGFRAGDRIVRVDGKDATEISLFKLRHLFQELGREIELVAQRGDETMTVKAVFAQ